MTIIGLMTWWVAHQQKKMNRQQLEINGHRIKLDLYDRRWAVYEATERFMEQVINNLSPEFEHFSRFNDRHFQSSINGLKRLLESVHSGGVVNIKDTVNLWHVPTKPPPKFSLGDFLLSHRVIQLNLWHG